MSDESRIDECLDVAEGATCRAHPGTRDRLYVGCPACIRMLMAGMIVSVREEANASLRAKLAEAEKDAKATYEAQREIGAKLVLAEARLEHLGESLLHAQMERDVAEAKVSGEWPHDQIERERERAEAAEKERDSLRSRLTETETALVQTEGVADRLIERAEAAEARVAALEAGIRNLNDAAIMEGMRSSRVDRAVMGLRALLAPPAETHTCSTGQGGLCLHPEHHPAETPKPCATCEGSLPGNPEEQGQPFVETDRPCPECGGGGA